MALLAQIIAHTPHWVWALYALLLFLGFQRTRDSSIALWRMLTLPLIVAVLAIFSVIAAGPGTLPAFLVGLMLGGSAGWRLEADGSTRRLPDGRVWLRGEWWSFAQLVAVLIFRYTTSAASAMDPALKSGAIWQSSTIFLSAALSALFLGRTLARLRAYMSATQEAVAPVGRVDWTSSRHLQG